MIVMPYEAVLLWELNTAHICSVMHFIIVIIQLAQLFIYLSLPSLHLLQQGQVNK